MATLIFIIFSIFFKKNCEQIRLYTQATSRCRIQLELETSLGKALIEENGCSLLKINNAA